MTILDSFFILFEGDTSKLDKGLKSADDKGKKLADSLHHVDEQANKVGAGFLGFMEKAAGLAGVALSVGALVHGINATAESYKQLEMLAARFRTTAEAVDNFLDVSKLLGITEEQATGGLTALSNAMQDTAMGMGRAQKVFEELHISVKGANGQMKSTTEVLGELQKKFTGMDRGKQIRIMERLGLDPVLLKLFNADMDGMRRRLDDIDRATGFSLDVAVKRSQEYTKASKGLGVEVNMLRMFITKMYGSMTVSAMPYFTRGLNLAAGAVRSFTDYLMQHAPFVKGVFIAISTAIAAYLIPAAISGALAVWAMIAPFALIGALVIAAGAAFALLYDDISNFLSGNESLIGNVLKRWPIIGEIVRDVIGVLRFLGEVAMDVGRIIGAELTLGFRMARAVAGPLFEWLADAVAGVAGFFHDLGGVVSGVFQSWIDWVSAFLDKFGGIIGIASKVAGAVRSVLGHAKNELGINGMPPETAQAVLAGQHTLALAGRSTLAASSSTSISHGARRGGDRNVHIDKIEIATQATDADGIARGVSQGLGSHLRQANGQFDDGVLG